MQGKLFEIGFCAYPCSLKFTCPVFWYLVTASQIVRSCIVSYRTSRWRPLSACSAWGRQRDGRLETLLNPHSQQ